MQHESIQTYAGSRFDMDLCLIVLQLSDNKPASLTIYQLKNIAIGQYRKDGSLPVQASWDYWKVNVRVEPMSGEGEPLNIPPHMSAIPVNDSTRMLLSRQAVQGDDLHLVLKLGPCEQAWLTSWNNGERYVRDSLVLLGIHSERERKELGRKIHHQFEDGEFAHIDKLSQYRLSVLDKFHVTF